MGLEPASVCLLVCSLLQTSIAVRPVGPLQSNFVLSIIGLGERLHLDVDRFRTDSSGKIVLEKQFSHFLLFVFHLSFVILAGNEDMRFLKSDQIRPPTANLAALEGVKKPHSLTIGKTILHFFLDVYFPVLIILAGNEDIHKSG